MSSNPHSKGPPISGKKAHTLDEIKNAFRAKANAAQLAATISGMAATLIRTMAVQVTSATGDLPALEHYFGPDTSGSPPSGGGLPADEEGALGGPPSGGGLPADEEGALGGPPGGGGADEEGAVDYSWGYPEGIRNGSQPMPPARRVVESGWTRSAATAKSGWERWLLEQNHAAVSKKLEFLILSSNTMLQVMSAIALKKKAKLVASQELNSRQAEQIIALETELRSLKSALESADAAAADLTK